MSKYRLNEKEKELVNFACDVCLKKHCKKHNVDGCNCAWQFFDNEYCPEIINKSDEMRLIDNGVAMQTITKRFNLNKEG